VDPVLGESHAGSLAEIAMRHADELSIVLWGPRPLGRGPRGIGVSP
jgi:hypothetical protein